MTQVARPEADTYYPVPPPNGSVQDSWRNELGEVDEGIVPFGLFESINTFLPNDLTFAESGAALESSLPEEIVPYVTKLSVVEDPSTAGEGLRVRVRLGKDDTEGTDMDCLVELREEYNNEITDLGILIASETFVGIPAGFREFSFNVTPEQSANIIDFDALYLRFVFTYR